MTRRTDVYSPFREYRPPVARPIERQITGFLIVGDPLNQRPATFETHRGRRGMIDEEHEARMRKRLGILPAIMVAILFISTILIASMR